MSDVDSAFERRVMFSPAYDKRAPKPEKDYGIGDMRITFALIGPRGAVQWMIGTGWYVRTAREHLASFGRSRLDKEREPQAWDLGYHAREALYEDQYGREECHLLGGPCFYDGSGLNAELLTERFLAEGEAYLWPALEAYYRCTFEDGPWPFEAEAAQAKAMGRFV